MSKTLQILLISYYFPPYDKVGGRRWAKHCKYFEREKINFQVIAGNFNGTSAWDKDITTYSNKITRVNTTKKYNPYHLRTLPVNILQKVKWKISLILWEKKKQKLNGNYKDVSYANESAFLEKVKQILVEHQINTIIISSGPFTYSKIFIELKSLFPQIKFMMDYRDYWEDGFNELTAEQKLYEINLQKQVVNCLDLILCPNIEMTNYYHRTFNKPVYHLPHCIDFDDLNNLPETKKNESIILILYGGAFYNDISENLNLIKQLTEQLNEIKETRTEFYVSIKGYENELNHKKITRFDFIDSNKYFEKVSQSDYVILILPPNRVNAMSSKFFELVALRKPILYFGGKGEVSDFIQKYRLGFHITKENIKFQAKLLIENLNTCAIPDLSYDITPHSFEFQTKKLITELQKQLN